VKKAATAALPASSLGKLLRARIDSSLPESKHFPSSPGIAVADLFPEGVCLQRYLFHNDDDGEESFRSFLSSYSDDPQWTVTSYGAYVHLTGKAGDGRRIEIYANVPVDLYLPSNHSRAAQVEARQVQVSAAIGSRKPVVLVHRGHDHHFPKTRPFLQSDARLVYLGSCFGSSNVEDVVTRCPRAQMIATRGIGATSVNDPFLKALNARLLNSNGYLDWDRFWDSVRPILSSNEHFSSYIPPHRNEMAVFLAGWYRFALSAP
jgi:hypothetical protein